ncbi:MAG: hypothetical protein JSW73_00820 [Candidatus Woesearchaeota archaeon]|nr:MAG: hypothetical protein JSW73_00820 [Candidatus Woesearchaeota archaeon]
MVREFRLKKGENLHQNAWLKQNINIREANIPNAEILNKKLEDLSYNNIVDAAGALSHIKVFKDYDASCLIVKHAYPISIATGASIAEVLEKSHIADKSPSLGGQVAVNDVFTADAAEYAIEYMGYITAIIAPLFEDEAVFKLYKNKKNTILIKVGSLDNIQSNLKSKKNILGGTLEQDRNLELYCTSGGIEDLFKPAYRTPFAEMTKNKGEKEGVIGIVTKKNPTLSKGVYDFAWKACKTVRSNGTSLAWEYEPGKFQTVGLGGGQGMRSRSLRVALMAYQDNKEAFPKDVLKKSVFGSDSFFFNDAVKIAADNKIGNIISSGGGNKSEEVIDSCDDLGIAMIYTGRRNFEHEF